MEEEEILRD